MTTIPNQMNCDIFNIDEYLTRIGLTQASLAGLNQAELILELMRHQLFSVVFENIDVQKGKAISLEAADIYRKIVCEGRGGYCYEVNGLFAMALEHFKIPYQFVAARPMFYPMLRPKTHMAIVATADQRQYLLDLGFGSYGMRAPMALDQLDTIIEQDFDQFKLTLQNTGEYLAQAKVGAEWQNQYEFNLSRQLWIDFAPANYMNSTHPGAIFVQKLLLIHHHPLGRNILLGNSLKTITKDKTEVKEIEASQLSAVIKSHFNLEL